MGQLRQAEQRCRFGKSNTGKQGDSCKGGTHHRERWSALQEGDLAGTQEMQDQHLRPHGFQKPPGLEQRHILKLQGRIGEVQIGHSASQHGAENIVEEQEGRYVEQRADRTEGQHDPTQRFSRPVSR